MGQRGKGAVAGEAGCSRHSKATPSATLRDAPRRTAAVIASGIIIGGFDGRSRAAPTAAFIGSEVVKATALRTAESLSERRAASGTIGGTLGGTLGGTTPPPRPAHPRPERCWRASGAGSGEPPYPIPEKDAPCSTAAAAAPRRGSAAAGTAGDAKVILATLELRPGRPGPTPKSAAKAGVIPSHHTPSSFTPPRLTPPCRNRSAFSGSNATLCDGNPNP